MLRAPADFSAAAILVTSDRTSSRPVVFRQLDFKGKFDVTLAWDCLEEHKHLLRAYTGN